MEIGMQENIYLDILFTYMEQISSWITMWPLIISSKCIDLETLFIIRR